MTSIPFFSIIIPTYNRAHLILNTLRSIQKQTFKDYEIIVVDNCSTDNTREVLADLIDSGVISFIQHDRNYERAMSRNTGMTNAKGKFVTFLDSDDMMRPSNLQDAFAFTRDQPGYHIFHNLYELINERSQPIYQYQFRSIKNPVKAIAKGNFLSCIGVFISRDIFSNYAFDTNHTLQGIEDWEFWMRILAKYSVGRIPKINNGIVHHAGRSITQYNFESYLEKKDYIVNKIKNDQELIRIYGPYLLMFESSCYMLAASQANAGGSFGVARNLLMRAFKKNPLLIFDLRFLRIFEISTLKLKSKI